MEKDGTGLWRRENPILSSQSNLVFQIDKGSGRSWARVRNVHRTQGRGQRGCSFTSLPLYPAQLKAPQQPHSWELPEEQGRAGVMEREAPQGQSLREGWGGEEGAVQVRAVLEGAG